MTAEAGDPQFASPRLRRPWESPRPRRADRDPLLDGPAPAVRPRHPVLILQFGYNILGRIIEKKTGQSYESHALAQVLRRQASGG